MSWRANSNDPECLVFVDEQPRSGQENMELDSRALEVACTGKPDGGGAGSICRLYEWNAPTVSLGYFQDLSTPVPTAIQDCSRVKRLTGGGAILHDRELTYSVAIPAIHSIRHQPLLLYEVIHKAIIAVLARQGIVSTLRRDSKAFHRAERSAATPKPKEPFLCFLRQDDRDIVLGEHKIVGSAQRRRKGAILQHGSILLKASTLLLNVPGLQNLCPEFDEDDFRGQLATALAMSIAPKMTIKNSPKEQSKLEQLYLQD